MVTSATADQIPTTLPVLPGVVLTGRYLLTDAEPLDRGDTMDAIVLPHRRVALMVADVVGDGIGAALAITQVRAVLSDRLVGGSGLLGALESVDAYAEHHPETRATTMCVAVLDLDSGQVEYGTAGHLPPAVLTPFEPPRMLAAEPGCPLGTGGEFHTGWAALGPDDLLVLYTDGLVSTPARPPDVANAWLLEVASSALDKTMAAPVAERGDNVCQEILSRFVAACDVRDDVALIVGARGRMPAPFSMALPARARAAVAIRAGLSDWLDEVGAGLLDHIGLDHVATELVTNSARHAYREDAGDAERPVRVDAVLDDRGSVSVTVSDDGQWCEDRSDGRGLMMASGLADSMDIRRGPRGTAVEVRLKMARPVQLLQPATDSHATLVLNDREVELHTVAERGKLIANGPVDETSVEVFHAALNEATRAGTASTTIDLSGVTHLASPGVQSLFEFVARSRRAGVEFCLVAPPRSPAGQILEIVGLQTSG